MPLDQILGFSDMVSEGLELESDARQTLREFTQLTATRGVAYAIVYQQATALSQAALLRSVHKKMERMEAILLHLKAVATCKTDLDETQKHEMGLVCRRILWEATRYDFDNNSIASAAWAVIEENKLHNNFGIYFSESRSATLEKNADSAMSERCSSAKAALRTLIIGYTTGENALSLTSATKIIAKRLGGVIDTRQIKAADIVRTALLRHYYRLNESVLRPKTKSTLKKRKRPSDVADNLADAAGAVDDGFELGTKVPPPPPGGDFWSVLLDPLVEKLKVLGSTDGDEYKGFVNSLIQEERRLFPEDKLPLLPLVERHNGSTDTLSPLHGIVGGPVSVSGSQSTGTHMSSGSVPRVPLMGALTTASGSAPKQFRDLMNPSPGTPISTPLFSGMHGLSDADSSASPTPARTQSSLGGMSMASGTREESEHLPEYPNASSSFGRRFDFSFGGSNSFGGAHGVQ